MGKKNKNLRLVTIKQDRKCKHCNGLIPMGTKCITVNKKYQGRAWYCSECVRLINNISDAKAQLNNTPFEDEVAIMLTQIIYLSVNKNFMKEVNDLWKLNTVMRFG